MTDSATHDFHDVRNPMLLSYSGIASYQTCRERWKLQNVYGLKTSTASQPMDLGSAVHAAMETYLKGTGTFQEGIARWVESVWLKVPRDEGDSVDDFPVMKTYLDEIEATALQVVPRIIDEINRRGLKVLPDPLDESPLVERELRVPMSGWDGFVSHIDAVMYDPDGLVWIVDFKVRKTFQSDDSEDVSLQNPIYQEMLARTVGIVADGTLTFQVRSTPMTQPKLTQKGAMSKAAIVCDWETYRQAVVDAGLDPADYSDMEDKLSTVQWTQVIKAYRSPEYTGRIWRAIVLPTAFEMSKVRDRLMSPSTQDRIVGSRQATRSLSHRTCNGCGVRNVCLGSLHGFDVSDALRPFKYREAIVQDAVERGIL